MFELLKIVLVRALIKTEITTLETALEAVASKVKTAEPKLVADIQLEVAKAKTIFVKYKAESEAELIKVKNEIRAAEQAVVAAAVKTAKTTKVKTKKK